MTDEEKKVCNCGELGRFFTLTAAIFLGVLLAILVSAALLRPQCPCSKGIPPMGRIGIERHMPPPPMGMHMRHGKKMHLKNGKNFDKQNFDFYGEDFQPPVKPEKNINK